MPFDNILQLITKTKEIETHVIPMRKKLRYIPVKRKKKTLRGEQKEIEKCSR